MSCQISSLHQGGRVARQDLHPACRFNSCWIQTCSNCLCILRSGIGTKYFCPGAWEDFSTPTVQVEASYLWEEEHVKAEQHSDTLEMDGWKKGRAPASHLPHNYAPWGNKGNGNAKSNSTCGSAGNKHQPSARHPGHHPLPHQHQAGLHTHSSDDTSAALHRGAMCTCESPAKGGRGHTLSKQQCPTTRNLRTRGTPNPRQTHPHLLLHVSTSQQRPPRSERGRPSPLHCCKPNKSFPMRT